MISLVIVQFAIIDTDDDDRTLGIAVVSPSLKMLLVSWHPGPQEKRQGTPEAWTAIGAEIAALGDGAVVPLDSTLHPVLLPEGARSIRLRGYRDGDP